MTIKELEQLVGLPRASIRFYEQEGFLSPQRLKNNYRDYSPSDARTLKRIKLLRQLHMDLDSIRRLEAGELTLTQALEEQLAALAADRGALDRAGEVCQSLLDSGTEYQVLDPEPWLEELERRPAPSGPHLERPRGGAFSPGGWTPYCTASPGWPFSSMFSTTIRQPTRSAPHSIMPHFSSLLFLYRSSSSPLWPKL